jgi:hypothetical protein
MTDEKRSVMRHPQATLGIVLAAMGLAAAISLSAAQNFAQPRPLKQFLEDNGWVSLPTPDRLMGPGSVVKVIKKDNAVSIQWVGDFRRCGITDREFGFVRGKYPALGIGQIFAAKASIAAGYIAKLGGTVDLEKASGAILQIEGSGGDAVSVRALAIWLASPSAPRRMSQLCRNFLADEDNYLVSEAFRISRAAYGLVDKNGARLPVAGAAFERIGPGPSATLSVADDLYVGVRGVKQLAPVLVQPSVEPRAIPDADALLRLLEP